VCSRCSHESDALACTDALGATARYLVSLLPPRQLFVVLLFLIVFLSHSYRTYLLWAAIVGSILTLLWLVVFFHDTWKLASAGGWTRLDWDAAWAER
jgi:hypothetical protein